MMSQYPHNRSFTPVSEAEMVYATRARDRPSGSCRSSWRWKGTKRGRADWSERLLVFPGRVPDSCQKQTERDDRTHTRHVNADPKH